MSKWEELKKAEKESLESGRDVESAVQSFCEALQEKLEEEFPSENVKYGAGPEARYSDASEVWAPIEKHGVEGGQIFVTIKTPEGRELTMKADCFRFEPDEDWEGGVFNPDGENVWESSGSPESVGNSAGRKIPDIAINYV